MLRLLSETRLAWRRPLDVADDDITTNEASTSQSEQSLALPSQTVDIVEGQWVTLDAAGKATLVTVPTRLAFPTFAAGERLDVNGLGQVCGLFGMFVAETDQFRLDTGDTYAAGTDLTVENGLLRPAAAGEPIVAVAEGPLSAATTAHPNGLLRFASLRG